MIARRAQGRRRVVLAVVVAMLATRSAPAQDPGPPMVAPPPLDVEQYVAGRVLVAGDSARPVAGAWVALNRVGDDSAGVIDSVRSARDGSYAFRYRRAGDPAALYFTDVRYAGVAYFIDPLRGARVVGVEADLVVFDTTSTGVSLRTRGRHFAVGPRTADGLHPVVEVFELTNDTSLTLVPAGAERPVWSVQLPSGARDPEVGEGDLRPGVVQFRRGRAELYAPIAPGLRQLNLRYTLPASAFPLDVMLADAPEVLEVLIASNDASAVGAGLVRQDAVTLEERRYERFLSQRARVGERVTIALARSALAPERAVPALLAVTALGLGGAWWWRGRRPAAAGTPGPPGSPPAH